MILRLHFTDFWKGFLETNNYFFNLLSKHYKLELNSKDPDIVIHSCYGNDHLNYDCLRVSFISENVRPDFLTSDFVISFDYLDHPRHLRLPLYMLYIEQKGWEEKTEGFFKEQNIHQWLPEWQQRKFCCMVVSNSSAKERINFFYRLSEYKPVDSGGRFLNNVVDPVKDKIEFIKNYKFVISFENSSYPGYTTEKILEPYITNSIPIYWGNPKISKEFNSNSFLNFFEFENEGMLINEIIKIDNNSDLAGQYLSAPKFTISNREYFEKQRIIGFFNKIIEASKDDSFIPVGKRRIKHLATIKRKINQINYCKDKILGRNFR